MMIHSTKAQQGGQWALTTDSQRWVGGGVDGAWGGGGWGVMSDCLSVSRGRQSMTPLTQHDHINNITKNHPVYGFFL